MKIVSCYDGMACGYISFKELGIQIDEYIASEVDKYAIQTATHNFPDIVEVGDIFNVDFTQYEGFDFLVGGSPCFTKGHMVLTDKGYKDISEVEIGDMVLTHKNRYKPVVRLYKHKAETVNVKIQGYPEFETTANHPFYTINREKASWAEHKENHSWRKFTKTPCWTRVDEMTRNTFCGTHVHSTAGKNPRNLTVEDCYILGRYVADGHLRNDKRKGRKDSYQYQLILSIGNSKLGEFKENVKEQRFSCFQHTPGVHRCVFSSQRLVELAKEYGRGAENKKIPEYVYDMPIEMIGAFIKGYMQGDGSYSEKADSYSATTISKELAFGLQRLLTAYYHTNVGVSCADNSREHYIGDREVVGKGVIYVLTFRNELKKQSVAHLQDNIMWTAFLSASPTREEKTVYNIEVADDNSYTVNNCIVHNCTYWSIAKKNGRETEASGLGWELFSQYVRALKEVKPKYFIYENNKSMSKAIRDSIRETFGFEEICINSALVSAQNRQRYYWVGKRNEDGTYSKVDVQQPEDRGIVLKDILETGYVDREKAHVLKHQAGNARDYFKKHHTQVALERIPEYGAKNKSRPVCYSYSQQGCGQVGKNCYPSRPSKQCYDYITEPVRIPDYGTDKARPLNAYYPNNCGGFEHRIWNENPAKQQVDLIAQPIQVGAMPRPNGELSTSQGFRNYSQDGKSVTLKGNAGGSGGKTGLYAMPIKVGEVGKGSQGNRLYSVDGKAVTQQAQSGGLGSNTGLYPLPIPQYAAPCEWDENGHPTKAISAADGKAYTVYEVKHGQITIKERQYPIKLIDGFYIIRKLTVKECMRLQTVPEWYEFPVSNTQAYKMLGNGWTIEVIKHLIKACFESEVI